MANYHIVDCEGDGDFEVEATNRTQACEEALAKLGFNIYTEKEYQEITK